MKHIIFIIIYVGFTTALYAQDQNDSTIRKGNPGEARTVSGKKQALVLHISGGKGEKYSALQYAQMLQIMFVDSARTKYPIKPYVLYEESGQGRATVMGVYMRGHKFDKNGGEYERGDGVFYPAEVLEYIPKITKSFSESKRKNQAKLK